MKSKMLLEQMALKLRSQMRLTKQYVSTFQNKKVILWPWIILIQGPV